MPFLIWITAVFIFITGCKRELSCEGCQHPVADGILNCDSFFIHGDYTASTTPNDSNYAATSVTVFTPGAYTIYSDTVNGYYFYKAGYFENTGAQQVTLKAYGQINSSDTSHFTFHFGNSVCTYDVGPPQDTEPPMYYSFVANGIPYSGISDSAYLTYQVVSGDEIYGMSFRTLLLTPSDSLFSLGVNRVNTPVTTGTYHAALAVADDFSGGINFSVNNEFIYGTSRYLPSFQIFLTDYGLPDRLVKGTFSGPVMDGGNNTIYITKGKFKTYLRH
ncbi:hypothetical protein FC093_18020 [Ilyomonas limi]|uniref:Uncharacterized protein n=1 Tax=Ilyomonas limi TaxID=2575867 RepID=A0A4U3KUS9_9BACT|nr:hypothetical protein [Ilyomonas limi]TKK66150.1 hypothetical protein FC093_18020 [Ilyomonas limi]